MGANAVGFLDLPHSIRSCMYLQVVRGSPASPPSFFSLSLVCRQVREEFLEAYDYEVNASFKCCIGRSLQDHNNTRFYSWNYHTTSWGASIELTPEFASKLRQCTVRCTIEELSDWQQRSVTGSTCLEECIRSLIRMFHSCHHMRDLTITFDHFVLSGRKGVLVADETWSRLKTIADLPGLSEVRYETGGLGVDFLWRKHKGGKKGKGKERWVQVNKVDTINREKKLYGDPHSWGLRRGIT